MRRQQAAKRADLEETEKLRNFIDFGGETPEERVEGVRRYIQERILGAQTLAYARQAEENFKKEFPQLDPELKATANIENFKGLLEDGNSIRVIFLHMAGQYALALQEPGQARARSSGGTSEEQVPQKPKWRRRLGKLIAGN